MVSIRVEEDRPGLQLTRSAPGLSMQDEITRCFRVGSCEPALLP